MNSPAYNFAIVANMSGGKPWDLEEFKRELAEQKRQQAVKVPKREVFQIVGTFVPASSP